MPAFPITRGTSQALYPFTQTFSFLTEVCTFVDGSQQRWVKRPGGPVVSFDFNYSRFSKSQKNTIETAVIAAKGQMSTSFTVALNGVSYTNQSLESDVFTAAESVTTQYGMSIKLKGASVQTIAGASTGSTFPTFSYGTTTQLPFETGHRFSTQAITTDSGNKYTYAFWSTQLPQWKCNWPIMPDADLPTLVQHFLWAQGRYRQFSFTNPDDSVSYTKCHYVSDELTITYNSVNSASVSVAIEAVR